MKGHHILIDQDRGVYDDHIDPELNDEYLNNVIDEEEKKRREEQDEVQLSVSTFEDAGD